MGGYYLRAGKYSSPQSYTSYKKSETVLHPLQPHPEQDIIDSTFMAPRVFIINSCNTSNIADIIKQQLHQETAAIYISKHEKTHVWSEIFKTDKENSFLAQYKVTTEIDRLFCNGSFSTVDNALTETNIDETSTPLLISILSSTLPAKRILLKRKKFFKQVKLTLEARGEQIDDLLYGLE